MDKQTYDSLYNKTIEDVTEDDLQLYTQILNSTPRLNSLWPCYFVAMSIFIPVWLTLPVPPLLIAALHAFPALFIGAFNGAMNTRFWDNITKLNISKQEYKQFKRSGGIKRIKKIVKEFEENPYKAPKIHPLPGGLTVADYEAHSKKQTEIVKQVQSQHDKQAQASYIDEIYNQAAQNIEQEK